jgi:hypothetical protein
VTFGFLLWVTRDTTFMQDEWDFLQTRLANDDQAFLRPHNNHLLAVGVLIYKVLWSTVGLGHYWPYQAAAIALHLTCVALVFELVRRRIGATVALAACLPLLVLGSAWEVVLIPFNYGWYISLAALLAIVLVLDRRGRGWDLIIGLLVALALASSSFGVPVAAGVGLTCVLGRQWRRLATAAVPAALYVVWFLTYAVGASSQPATHLTLSPVYFLHTAAGSVAALLGAPMGIEPVRAREWLVVLLHLLTVALFAGLAYQLAARRRALTPTLVLVLTSLLGYWLVLSATRGYTGFGYTSRYHYIGPLLLVVLGAEYLRPTRIPSRWVAAVLGAGLLAAAANTAVLLHHAAERRHDATVLRAELGALEIARDRVPPTFHPDHDRRRAVTIVALSYFRAIDRIGSSPAPSPAELEHMPGYARAAADAVLRRAEAH